MMMTEIKLQILHAVYYLNEEDSASREEATKLLKQALETLDMQSQTYGISF